MNPHNYILHEGTFWAVCTKCGHKQTYRHSSPKLSCDGCFSVSDNPCYISPFGHPPPQPDQYRIIFDSKKNTLLVERYGADGTPIETRAYTSAGYNIEWGSPPHNPLVTVTIKSLPCS